jgi:hypothetical protein
MSFTPIERDLILAVKPDCNIEKSLTEFLPSFRKDTLQRKVIAQKKGLRPVEA